MTPTRPYLNKFLAEVPVSVENVDHLLRPNKIDSPTFQKNVKTIVCQVFGGKLIESNALFENLHLILRLLPQAQEEPEERWERDRVAQ